MKRSLQIIFDEAIGDFDSVILNGVGYLGVLSMGFKIVKDEKTHEVKIFNTHFGGDNYKELTFEEYFIVQENGWRCGIIRLALNTFENKINKVKSILNDKSKKTDTEVLEDYLMFLEERYSLYLKKKEKFYNQN